MKKTKNDIMLVAALLLLALAVWGVVKLTEKPGAVAVVTVDGTEVGRYPLSEDITESLAGGGNVLRIEAGEAYIEHADCPDLLCVKQGRIKSAGESIVCLPHKLVVTVYGGETPDIDAVAG